MSNDPDSSKQTENTESASMSSAGSGGLFEELKPRHEAAGLADKFLHPTGEGRQTFEEPNSPRQRLKISDGSVAPGETPELFGSDPQNSALTPARNQFGTSNYDPYAMTPWLKRRGGGETADSKESKKRFLLFSASIILIAPVVAVLCAFSYVPNGPATAVLLVGEHFHNHGIIKSAVRWGWPDPNYAAGVLLGAANQQSDTDHAGAMELYDEVLRLSPNFPNGYMNRGLNWHNMGNYEKAHADYDRALQLNPRYATAHNNRGNLYTLEQKYDLALKDLTLAVQYAPERGDFYYNRGLLRVRMGDRDGALSDFDTAEQRTRDRALIDEIRRQQRMLRR